MACSGSNVGGSTAGAVCVGEGKGINEGIIVFVFVGICIGVDFGGTDVGNEARISALNVGVFNPVVMQLVKKKIMIRGAINRRLPFMIDFLYDLQVIIHYSWREYTSYEIVH